MTFSKSEIELTITAVEIVLRSLSHAYERQELRPAQRIGLYEIQQRLYGELRKAEGAC